MPSYEDFRRLVIELSRVGFDATGPYELPPGKADVSLADDRGVIVIEEEPSWGLGPRYLAAVTPPGRFVYRGRGYDVLLVGGFFGVTKYPRVYFSFSFDQMLTEIEMEMLGDVITDALKRRLGGWRPRPYRAEGEPGNTYILAEVPGHRGDYVKATKEAVRLAGTLKEVAGEVARRASQGEHVAELS